MRKPDNLEARETTARLYEESWAADVAVNNAPQEMSDEDFAKLTDRAVKAEHDYKSQPLRVMISDNPALAERCALTNVPLLVDDEISLVLSSAIGAENYNEDEPLLPMFSEMEPA